MRAHTTILLSVSLMALAACGSKKSGGKGGDKPAAGKVECTVLIGSNAKLAAVSGTSNGPDEAKVKEDAWADACKKLPADQQASCKDSSKYSAAESGGSAAWGGK